MADYATLLRDRVTLAYRSIDRIFLQAYSPKLQSVGMVCNFLYKQRGFAIPSSAAFGRIGQACVEQRADGTFGIARRVAEDRVRSVQCRSFGSRSCQNRAVIWCPIPSDACVCSTILG